MSDFVYLFRISDAEQREHMGSPERAQQSMQMWMAWLRDLEAKGHLNNRGLPLERSGKVVRANHVVTDGPFAEVKDLVAGFIVVTAKDVDTACEIAAGCPILQGSGAVEVRPVMNM